MRQISLRPTQAVSVLSALLLTATALAHSDDPKARDRMPPYRGPGYKAGGEGVSPVQFAASNVTLMSWLPCSDFGLQVNSGNSCWGYVSPSGREYAIIGLSHGTGFVEITDAGDARIVALVPGPVSLWRDMKTYQNYCYSVSEGGNGIQVIDLSQIDNNVVTLVREVTTGGTTATHTVAIDTTSGFLYRCGGGSNGLRIYNLSNPSNPSFVTSWTTRYVHECQAVTYTSGPNAGKQIVLACDGANGGFQNTGLEILDVTNKSNIITRSRVTWPNAGFSHQVWLSEDRNWAYLNDEFDEQSSQLPTTTYSFNMTNLNSVTLASTFTNGNPAIGHNLYVRNNLIFEANYRSGLHIFDATNPTAPVEIGFIDTFPQDDTPQFNGAWCTYPFFPSGTVIISDIESGLFVVRVGPPQLDFAYPNGLPSYVPPSGAHVRVTLTPQNGGQVQAGTARVHFDSGAGYSSAPMTSLGGDQYEAVIPGAACMSTIKFYFTARTTDGATWRDPQNLPGVVEYSATAAGIMLTRLEDMETDTGWTVGSPTDTATAGQWVRVDPIPSLVQRDDDHTPNGTMCWVTGQGVPGGGYDDADVDGGTTTLTSPIFDATGADQAFLSYWRLYFDGFGYPTTDPFIVEISNNGGATWQNLETVGPGGIETNGDWLFKEWQISSVITPTNQMRVRFIAEDLGADSTIEAAIDDVVIRRISCAEPPCRGDLNGDHTIDSGDLGILLSAWQTSGAGDLDGDGDTDSADLGTLLGHWGSVCP
ncbi:MAG: choice-of-anchor B family protein [Phycisphaerae bacterium]